ncbi:MAG: hypothetical protein PHF63_00795 [Herbinix sp.]|nr:hypothetical protein [Herbinix sp.]
MAKDVANDNELVSLFKRNKSRSITQMAKEATLQFPVIISRSIDLETAQIVTKAIEREMSTVTQLAMNLNPTQELGNGSSMVDYIKQFHQNSDDRDRLLPDMVDNLAGKVFENYTAIYENENVIMFAGEFSGNTKALIESNSRDLTLQADTINHVSLNDIGYKTPNLFNVREAVAVPPKKEIRVHDDLPTQKLVDNDVKKANELISTLIQIRVRVINEKDKSAVGFQDILIGVKAVMHPVTSLEVIDNIQRAVINSSVFFNFIRWTTGEISFFKDFLLNVDDIKSDVADRSLGRSNWWIALKRRKAVKNAMKLVNPSKAILPNATIVVGMEEVNILKEQYGINLMDERVIYKIMNSFFLLGFVVVDDFTKMAHFLFDGNNSFQTTSFSGLERENGRDEKKFKDMLKMLNRSY